MPQQFTITTAQRTTEPTTEECKQYHLKKLLGWQLLHKFCEKKYFDQFPKVSLKIGDIELQAHDLREADDYAYVVHTTSFDSDLFVEMVENKAVFVNNTDRPLTSMSYVDHETQPSGFEQSCLFPLQLVYRVPPECIKATIPEDGNTTTAVTEKMFPGRQAAEVKFYDQLQREITRFDLQNQQFCHSKETECSYPLPPVYQEGILSDDVQKADFGSLPTERKFTDMSHAVQTLCDGDFETYEYPYAPISTVEAVKRRTKPNEHNELVFSRLSAGMRNRPAELVAYMINEEWFNEFIQDDQRLSKAMAEMRDKIQALAAAKIPIILVRIGDKSLKPRVSNTIV